MIAVAAATASATAGTVEVATAGGFVLVANVHHKVAVGFIAAIGFLDSETKIYSAPFRALPQFHHFRCLFDPWIRDSGWVKNRTRIRDEQSEPYFRELRNHFFGLQY